MRDAVQHQHCDVLILSRGGGSLEDLWCFNHEQVAREIYNCPIPVVSGVGHEVDVTIADLVADLRAPTPTAAAELVSPNTEQLSNQLASFKFRLPRSFERVIQRQAQQVDFLGRQLIHPNQQLQQNRAKLAQTAKRLQLNISTCVSAPIVATDNLAQRLQYQNPQKRIRDKAMTVNAISQRLQRASTAKISDAKLLTQNIASQLNLVSPLATLERGFSIGRDCKNDILRSTQQVNTDDSIELQLSDGKLECNVTKII